ncbi:hypothetical protein J1605_007950 [Eschrichtius robustus]|uniref:Uncharacterized protein n=1 Tax=Eschrichtius robustus TaxID=9764 RepID=A0AB34GYQ8_ESCRO|nr:hypothetical protein J1605_007950 [Eschrichtius robustus]
MDHLTLPKQFPREALEEEFQRPWVPSTGPPGSPLTLRTPSRPTNESVSLHFPETGYGVLTRIRATAAASGMTWKSILSDKTSRNLFFFLCLNLSFAFVELLYGIWSN